MNLKDLKDAYKGGLISKPYYIDQMHEAHRALFEYAEFIKGTDAGLIQITDGAVDITTRAAGIRLYCDMDDKRIIPVEILNFDSYESAELSMVLSLIGDGSSILDIGGNVGWYSLNIAKAKKGVAVHTFEPIPKTFGYLVKNIAANGPVNVTPHNFGFSDEERDIPFYYYKEGSGNASSADLTGGEGVETVVCHVRRLDDFAAESGLAVDFIKCDVEGAELHVFRGGMETIAKQRPVIFVELLRKWAAKFGYHPNEVIGLLRGAGYRCFTASGGRLSEFFVMDEGTKETNFFFLHSEKHGPLIDGLAG